MNILQSILSAFEDNPYDKKRIELLNIFVWEQWYCSLAMDVVIFCLALYFIRIKRYSRFESTILVFMFLKYALYAF